jgi:hypothetical protein
MFRLPVSGVEVHLRLPSGADDLLLLETHASDPALAVMLVERLDQSGGRIGWTALPVPDLEAAMLLLRQKAIGDLVRADMRCSCRARIDIGFRIGEYLSHSVPRMPRYVEPTADSGWFTLSGTEVVFRIPTVADQIAVAGSRRPDFELERQCIRPATVSRALIRKTQQALEAIAPSLSRSLQGACPECNAKLNVYFDVYGFVLRELSGRAQSLYEDVHLIAQRYHWPESRILALPRTRRRQYAEMIRDERGV